MDPGGVVIGKHKKLQEMQIREARTGTNVTNPIDVEVENNSKNANICEEANAFVSN